MVKMFIESLKNLASKPVTIKYPAEPSPEPKNYRGTIYYEEDLCIFCDLCEDICPPGAILFEIVDFENNKREYSYNPYLCIYCNACVKACPKADDGCLVQDASRLAPLGRDSTLPKDIKLGYFMNSVNTAKDLDQRWSEFEQRTEVSRKGYEEHKAEKKRKKQAEAKAKKEALARENEEAKAKEELEVKSNIETTEPKEPQT